MSSDTKTNPVVGHSTSSAAILNGVSPKQSSSSSLKSHASPSGAFSRLIEAVKDCTPYEEAYREIEGTQNRLVQADSDLKRAKADLMNERKHHSHLITRHAEGFRDWAAEKSVLEAAIEKLEETLEEERAKMNETLKAERKRLAEVVKDNEKLEGKLKETKENIFSVEKDRKAEKANTARLEMELAQTRRAKSDLTSELTVCKEELHEWTSYSAVLTEVDVGDLSNKMHNLWTRFQKFAENYFLVDVSESLFADPVQWDNLITPLCLVTGVPPLPPRNSIAAKKMRLVAVLAFLADRIDYQIFAPIYTNPRNDGIRDLLLQYSDKDIKKEAACRALILSAYTEDHQKKAAETIVSDITDEVSDRFSWLLNPSAIDGFRAELKKLIHEAATHWSLAQRSLYKIEATVEDVEEREWNRLNILEGEGEEAASNQFLIALFPRVFITRDDGWRWIFPGVALFEWQTEAADIEWEQHKAAVKSAKRTTPPRGPGSNGRRMSRNDGYGSAHGSPTSPTSTSFLDRRNSGPGRGNGSKD